MQSFDIVTLRVFLAVARQGSIGAAARNEHIAASAASRRISDLEYDLDTTLITRTPTGTRLTPAGRVFARYCEELLGRYADVRADLKRFADGEAGEFRIAAVPRALDGTLPFIIGRFKQDHPEIHVTLQEVFSRQGIRYLREDLADLAVIYDSVDLKEFSVIPYKKDPIWVFGHKDHPLLADKCGAEAIRFEETLDYEQISFHEGGVLDELVSEARRRKGRTSKYNSKVLRAISLVRCVEAGLGLGIIGERDLQPHLQKGTLKGLPLADKWASRSLACVYPKGQAASPTVQKFMEYLSEQKM